MTNLRFIVVGIAAIIIGLFLFSSVYTVHQTQQALILEFGQPRDEETEPGLHFKLPWQTATYYEKRVLSLDPPEQEIILSDQKRVNVDAFVRYLIVHSFALSRFVVSRRTSHFAWILSFCIVSSHLNPSHL